MLSHVLLKNKKDVPKDSQIFIFLTRYYES